MTLEISGADVLGDALRALKVEGTVLLRESYTPPFAVEVPSAEELAAHLKVPRGARVVAFHLAELETFELRSKGPGTLLVKPGESVFCFGGQGHRLALGAPAQVVGFESLLGTDAAQIYQRIGDGEVGQVRIVCGALILHDTWLNPLFSSLPDALLVGSDEAKSTDRARRVTSWLLSEFDREDPAGSYVVERLLEVLCAEGIRQFATRRQEAIGWLRGLADPDINRALATFHADPGSEWSIARMAGIVNLSASRFAARFAAATGESVMAYVRRWRMNLAMRALKETGDGVHVIASRVGYDSLPAFSRAFKRHLGKSPAAFRSASLSQVS